MDEQAFKYLSFYNYCDHLGEYKKLQTNLDESISYKCIWCNYTISGKEIKIILDKKTD